MSVRFAEPRQVDRPQDCLFYHALDLPGVGTVGEQWDLRSCIDDYLGRFDFRGKRVLDVGTAGGYLTFAMEQRGAEVVSFDMADGAQWDVVPRIEHQARLPEIRERNRALHRKLQNAYWFSHRRLGSKAKVFYGDVYNLPTELGPFDAAVFGMILSHLRDPFQALYSASRLVEGSLIVTNQLRKVGNGANAMLIPAADNGVDQAWWAFSPECLRQIMAVFGFEVQRSVACRGKCLVDSRAVMEECTALVAQRVAGKACLPDSAPDRGAAA
jgi:SAM-dependent methyltransferase